ncbi:ABC transporter permease [Xinfangfangia sp. CPCC 101601]|uniref:ABC transporter permease n=1 Tax=Pseudogemmobacter lacusdianii TaxID=3069608 RepID=A0ABU0W145_9RHOB|nr:ABC transporter permease [Xinfangfangia sp. CPCC 101601]MDQ2067737.1 ABC transporter permease [Xinfangfangia sp. CPCC 101601]
MTTLLLPRRRRLPFRLTPSAALGVAIILFYAVLAVFAPQLAPYGEAEIVGSQFELWSEAFPLGTDNLGRDVLSRLIYGARNTIGITLTATFLAFVIGTGFGLWAAGKGGAVDRFLSTAVNVFMSIPLLIFALLLLALFGTSLVSLVVIVALLEATRVYRVVRAVAMNVMVSDYVEVARVRGEGLLWILWSEVLPNIRISLFAELGLRFCFIFLLISGLSFLGLGIQPPAADWGSMVKEYSALIAYGDITPLLPAGAIATLSISVNLVVDWLVRSRTQR